MPVQIAYARRPLARKPVPARLNRLGENQFEGYASLFNTIDGAGDSVAPGAFASSLRKRGPGGIRMLYQHFAHAPIGVWDEIREDSRGLYVKGTLVGDVPQARDVAALLRAGALNGLSIGFRTVRAKQVQAGADAAARFEAHANAQDRQIQTVIRKVPVYVSEESSSVCAVLPWGAVRLLDAAASGADPDDARARIAPGVADDAPSDVTLPEAVTLLATDLGIARRNAEQLKGLEALQSR